MKKTILLIFILGMGIIADADSQSGAFESANAIYTKLLKRIDGNPKDFYDNVYATGYVIGVYDARNGIDFSAPLEATAYQLCAIVKKHFENNPEKLHLRAASLIIEAFEKAFPIKEIPVFPESANNGIQMKGGNHERCTSSSGFGLMC